MLGAADMPRARRSMTDAEILGMALNTSTADSTRRAVGTEMRLRAGLLLLQAGAAADTHVSALLSCRARVLALRSSQITGRSAP